MVKAAPYFLIAMFLLAIACETLTVSETKTIMVSDTVIEDDP